MLVGNNRMTYDQFLPALGEIAARKFGPELSRAEAFKRLVYEVRRNPSIVSGNLVPCNSTHAMSTVSSLCLLSADAVVVVVVVVVVVAAAAAAAAANYVSDVNAGNGVGDGDAITAVSTGERQHVVPLKKLIKRWPDELSQELGIAERLAAPEVVRFTLCCSLLCAYLLACLLAYLLDSVLTHSTVRPACVFFLPSWRFSTTTKRGYRAFSSSTRWVTHRRGKVKKALFPALFPALFYRFAAK